MSVSIRQLIRNDPASSLLAPGTDRAWSRIVNSRQRHACGMSKFARQFGFRRIIDQAERRMHYDEWLCVQLFDEGDERPHLGLGGRLVPVDNATSCGPVDPHR